MTELEVVKERIEAEMKKVESTVEHVVAPLADAVKDELRDVVLPALKQAWNDLLEKLDSGEYDQSGQSTAKAETQAGPEAGGGTTTVEEPTK